MVKIGEGESAEVFRYDQNIVVKLFKEEFYEEKYFNMEFNAAQFMGNNSHLAPEVFEKVKIDGRHGYTMTEVKGEIFQNIIDQNGEKIEDYAKLLGQTHKKLHDIQDLKNLTELDIMKEFFSRSLDKDKHFDRPVGPWLKDLLLSINDQTVLTHGDFMPYNMIMNGDSLKVVDWAEPMLGHPLADVARTINFINDSSDYPDSQYTIHSEKFINTYLASYLQGEQLDRETLHKCLIINAYLEYSWAVYSKQEDAYSNRLREFIEKNFKKLFSDQLISIK